MTDSEINIAIAKDQGWKVSPFGGLYPPDLNQFHNLNQKFEVPNYCNDLNAMSEVVKGLNDQMSINYYHHLHNIVYPVKNKAAVYMIIGCVEATARQRAEAYLRVNGLWEENK